MFGKILPPVLDATTKVGGKILDILTYGIKKATVDDHAYLVHCRVSVTSEMLQRPIVDRHLRNLVNEYGHEMVTASLSAIVPVTTTEPKARVVMTQEQFYDNFATDPFGKGWQY